MLQWTCVLVAYAFVLGFDISRQVFYLCIAHRDFLHSANYFLCNITHCVDQNAVVGIC